MMSSINRVICFEIKILLSYVILGLLFSCVSKTEKRAYNSKHLEDMDLYGKVKSVKVYTMEDNYEHTFFDQNGNKTKSIDYKENEFNYLTEFKYNKDDLLEYEISYYSSDNDTLSLYKYNYNSSGQLIREDYYEDDFEKIYLSSYVLFKYDNEGNLKRHDFYDSHIEGSNGEIVFDFSVVFHYNDKKLIVKEQSFGFDNKLRSEKIFEYDDFGNTIYIKKINKNGIEYSCKMKYDNYNNYIYQNCSDADKPVYVKNDYDFNKNWILKLKKIDTDEEFGIIGHREIEYY